MLGSSPSMTECGVGFCNKSRNAERNKRIIVPPADRASTSVIPGIVSRIHACRGGGDLDPRVKPEEDGAWGGLGASAAGWQGGWCLLAGQALPALRQGRCASSWSSPPLSVIPGLDVKPGYIPDRCSETYLTLSRCFFGRSAWFGGRGQLWMSVWNSAGWRGLRARMSRRFASASASAGLSGILCVRP
ncbi:hypothetical protein GGE66_006656 [Rhizobium leguminosarum]|uniref:Uncharacterized protein n=1 Tax=Rhizobium leguminosarum TaxID=384 RepID=A0A7X0A0Q5_RHILE|nr:hypothetical protein [Rhizobium leguminosarum]